MNEVDLDIILLENSQFAPVDRASEREYITNYITVASARRTHARVESLSLSPSITYIIPHQD